MPTKSANNKELQENILKLYLEGKTQEEIFEKLSGYDKSQDKDLRKFIRESEYLSPKNFRIGAIALFITNILSAPLGILLRGDLFYSLFPLLVSISIAFSTPFLVLGIMLYRTKNLRTIYDLSLIMLVYLSFYVFLFALLAYTTKILAIVIFPAILLPTFLGEFFKLKKLLKAASSASRR